MRQNLPKTEVERRLAVVDKVIAGGGNVSRVADELRMTPRGAALFIRRYAPDRMSALLDAKGKNDLDRHHALVRLLLIKVAAEFKGGRRRLAQALGCSHANLCIFVARWAPDGLDAAIADLWPEEGEAAHG